MRSKEQVVLEEFVVPQPAARFIQGLRGLVRCPGAENEALRPRLDRVLPCSLEQRSADAAPSNVRADEQVVQDPEGLERDGRERRVELGEPGGLSRTRVRKIDHGFVAFDPVAKERARRGRVGALPVKLTISIEKWHEVVEILGGDADDPCACHDIHTTVRNVSAMFRRVLFVLVFVFVMINFHEIGHTVFARLLGDDSAHYVLYQADGRSSCMGCNLYDSSRLADIPNVLVNLGGVIFTQLLCWIAIFLLAGGERAGLKRWMLLTAIVITWFGDVVVQLVQGLTANVPQVLPRRAEITYTDYQAVVWFIRDQTGAAVSDLKTVLLLATIGYSGLLLLATRWALERGRGRGRTEP